MLLRGEKQPGRWGRERKETHTEDCRFCPLHRSRFVPVRSLPAGIGLLGRRFVLTHD